VNAALLTKRNERKEVARLVWNARLALGYLNYVLEMLVGYARAVNVQLMFLHGVVEVPMAMWTRWTIGLVMLMEQTAKVRAVE